jgi:hypothetical protein
MKASNIDCELKHYISTMILCGNYMHKCSVGKDTKKNLTMIKGEGTW